MSAILPTTHIPRFAPWATIAVGAALLAGALAASALNHRLGLASGAESGQRLRVATAPAAAGPATTTLRFTGVARAGDRRAAAFTLGGRLAERPVRSGDRLEAGALVARLDPQPFLAARDAARARHEEVAARLAQAQRDRDRAEDLAKVQAIGREQAERLRAEVAALHAAARAAAAALAEAERQCGETELRAPWPALVSAVEVEPGEVVAAGQAVARLERSAGSEVPLAVPPSLVGRLAPGRPARLLPLGGEEVPGRVASVAAAADRSRLCEVLVGTQAAIAPGSAVTVLLEADEPATVSVPLTALVDRGGGPAVALVEPAPGGGARLRLRAVALRAVAGDRALLAPGAVAPGAAVAVAGHQQAGDGAEVEAGDGR